MRRGLAVLTALLALPAPAAAQAQLPSWFSIDTTAAVDRVLDAQRRHDRRHPRHLHVGADRLRASRSTRGRSCSGSAPASGTVRCGWPRPRYEHKGAVGLRIEGGLIPAPIGLANLTLRPQLNPTISQPSSLFQGLPPPEPFSPRVTLLGAIYPYGVSATVSGAKWDARAALIDVSPLRARRIFGRTPTRPGSRTWWWAAA